MRSEAKVLNFEDFALNIIEGGKSKKNVPKNTNPKKEHSTKVYPIKEKKYIQAVIDVLDERIKNADTPTHYKIAKRNKMLFIVGINVGVRASDLVRLQFSFFINEDGTLKDSYAIKPYKTRKYNKYVHLHMNEAVKRVVSDYYTEFNCQLNDFLFESREGKNKSLDTKSLWRIIDKLAKDAKIPYNIGSHSLRQTFGYWCYNTSSDKTRTLTLLQKIFNHSSSQVTLAYIGITDTEVSDVFNGLDFGIEF